MRVIVSGPTGAIGHALIENCISNGFEVLAICRKNSSRINTIPKDNLVKILELDLDEYNSFSISDCENIGEYDVFFHFAWDGTIGPNRNNTDIQCNNIKYTLDAVELANRFGCRCFIGAGSQAEYGRVEGILKPDTPTFPETGYGIAKLCAGDLSRLRCQQLEIRHIWVRILSIYGPYDGEKTMIISSLRKLINSEEAQFTKGEQKWDFLFSKDAASAMILLAEKGKNNKTYVLGSGIEHELKEYICKMADVLNKNDCIKLGTIPYSDKQVMRLCADISELKNDTGFCPIYNFDEGIKETIDYIRKSCEL